MRETRSGPRGLATAVAVIAGLMCCETLAGQYFAPVVVGSQGAAAIQGCVGDFDNDQRPDIVTAELGWIYFFKGLGSGSLPFQAPVTSGYFAAIQVPGLLRAADFDQDGNLDVLVRGNSSAGGLCLCLGTGSGTFSVPVCISPVTAVKRVVVSDVNVDGRPDLVITRELPPPACSLQNPDSLEVWLNLPSGWLAAWSEATPWMTYDITMGDYNGDGYPDIAWGGVPPYGCLLTPSDCELKVKLGTGTGTFGATSTLLPSLVPGGCIGKLASQDMDSDGYDDVVMLMGGWPATYVQLLYGHPTQNLAVGAAVAVLSYSPIGWFVGDVDGDGVKDPALFTV